MRTSKTYLAKHFMAPLKIQISSFRRRPESSIFNRLDTGLRRCDEFLEVPFTTLRNLALCAALGVAGHAMAQPIQQNPGQALPIVEIYKSAQCGCCKLWAEHLQRNGFEVILHNVDDVPAARKKLGMPDQYGSCHTARAGQYLIEGHVPAADIKRLLRKRPRAIGLAVPAMPPGSPGMESDDPVPYDTLLVGKDGNAKVFARH